MFSKSVVKLKTVKAITQKLDSVVNLQILLATSALVEKLCQSKRLKNTKWCWTFLQVTILSKHSQKRIEVFLSTGIASFSNQKLKDIPRHSVADGSSCLIGKPIVGVQSHQLSWCLFRALALRWRKLQFRSYRKIYPLQPLHLIYMMHRSFICERIQQKKSLKALKAI